MSGEPKTKDAHLAVLPVISGPRGFTKRLCDLVFAGFGLITLSPIMLLIALMLYGSGFRRPVFIQPRVGLNGQIFTIIKFRTLRDETCRPVRPKMHRISNRFAALLRISGFDELPQLINVLRGEMSLVGPRPHNIADHTEFSTYIAGYDDRLATKPGITGLAQIYGWRGQVCSHDHLRARIAHDCAYVARHSTLLDMRILIRTMALPVTSLIATKTRHSQPCQNIKTCHHCNRRLV
ncbi:sugar transferase [Thalassospira australica]|uniref:sugar transferase n=1 Tax=Thalassospira australica TaxID=1528106 RepID=UPI00068FFABC|nr:sugar transferase [Thalassospira australica]